MKKYAETVELYNKIRERLAKVLVDISKVEFKESEERWYTPCTRDRYVLCTQSTSKFNYWYFYSLDSRDKDFSIETNLNSVSEHTNSVFACTVFDSKKVLVHDMLSKGGKILRVEYPLRYNLLIETLGVDSIKINSEYKIKVAIKFTAGSDRMVMDGTDGPSVDLDVFRKNFKYSCDYFLCISSSYEKKLVKWDIKSETRDLVIRCGKKSEIYNVYTMETNECFGLLYIKTLKDSKYIRDLTQGQSEIVHSCKFNERFKKWQLVV